MCTDVSNALASGALSRATSGLLCGICRHGLVLYVHMQGNNVGSGAVVGYTGRGECGTTCYAGWTEGVRRDCIWHDRTA